MVVVVVVRCLVSFFLIYLNMLLFINGMGNKLKHLKCVISGFTHLSLACSLNFVYSICGFSFVKPISLPATLVQNALSFRFASLILLF